MGVSCITTLTAFLVTNARHVFHLRVFNLFVWITPVVVGTDRHLRRAAEVAGASFMSA